MESKTVFLKLLYLLASCFTISESCNAAECKIHPSAADVSSEFQSLVSEKGVRIVYMYLKVGNISYRPLDQKNVFFPERWIWANSISEPMLSMEYNYDIFSLGLLSYQARSINVNLVEEPSGCLAGLNYSCQSFVVGKVLLEDAIKISLDKPLSQNADVVCVALIGKENDPLEGNIEYHCCGAEQGGRNTSEPLLNCDLSIKKSGWYVAFDYVLLVATIIISLFCPAFPFALPDEIVMDIGNEIRKEANAGQEQRETTYGSVSNRQTNENETSQTSVPQNAAPSAIADDKNYSPAIPVDDTSPITCSVLMQSCANKFPGFQLSFNVKLVFLSYFVVPFFLYVVMLLNLTLKGDYLKEAFRKDKAYLGGIEFFLFDLFRGIGVVFFFLFGLAPFVIIVCLIPKDLIEKCKISFPSVGIENATRERTVGDRIRVNLLIMQDKVYQIFSSSSQSYSNGLTKFLEFTIKAFLKKADYSLRASRMRRILCVLCVLIFSLLGFLFGVALAGIFLAIFLVKTAFFAVYFSPSLSVVGFLWGKLVDKYEIYYQQHRHCQCSASNIRALVFTILFALDAHFAIITACSTVSICCYLTVKVFGYTLMGIVLNAAIATPYAVFLFVVITNVYFCYSCLQNRYKVVKEIISKEWQKNKERLLQDQRHFASNSDNTIPRELFWFVCGDDLNAEYTILPIQTEMLFMLRNMIYILAFLFLSLSSVIIFGNLYQISTVVSSIAVFISGVIPKLILQGFAKEKKVMGWEKIKMTKQIERAVKKYIEYLNSGERPKRLPEELGLNNMTFIRIMPDVNEAERTEYREETMELLLTAMKSVTTRE